MKPIRLMLLVFSCTTWSTVALYAQVIAGVKAGVNYATFLADSKSFDYGYLPGSHAGAFVGYGFKKSIVAAEILYSRQGATIDSEYWGNTARAIAQYVLLPVSVRYYIIPAVNIHAGPQVGFLTIFESDCHPVTKEKEDYFDDFTTVYKKTDVAFNFGLGGELPNGLFLEVRYSVGLTDISNYMDIDALKNRVFMVSVGYKVKFTK